MEERASYMAGNRPGKTFVGGWLSVEAAERLRKAADLNEMNMTELLEWLADRVTATLEPKGCGCKHGR